MKKIIVTGGAGFIGTSLVKALLRNDVEKILIIDDLSTCLLYTSPSPRDATLSRMPSSA